MILETSENSFSLGSIFGYPGQVKKKQFPKMSLVLMRRACCMHVLVSISKVYVHLLHVRMRAGMNDVCMYACMHICTYRMYIRTCVRRYVCLSVCMYVRTYVCHIMSCHVKVMSCMYVMSVMYVMPVMSVMYVMYVMSGTHACMYVCNVCK